MAIFDLNSLSDEERKKYLQQIQDEEINNRNYEEQRRQEAIKSTSWNDKTQASQLGYDDTHESKNTIFNHNNLFSDGWQFWDLSRTALGTGVDIFNNVVHGVSNLSEKISDKIEYKIADLQDTMGNTEYANRLRAIASKDDWNDDSNIVGKFLDNYTNKDSVLGDKTDQLNQGIGYSAMLGAIGAIPVVGGALEKGATYVSGASSGEGQAYNEQYQEAVKNGFVGSMADFLNSDEGKDAIKKAKAYGKISGGVELATESMAGGLGKMFTAGKNVTGVTKGLGGLDDILGKKLANNFKSQVAKNLAEYGVKSAGEGFEEVVGGLADALGQKITYKKGEKYWDLVKDQNIPESALSATISSAIMQSPQFVQTTKAGRDFITNMTPQEENLYNEILSNKQKQFMKDKTINNEIDTKYKDLTDEEKTQKYQELSTAYDNYDIKPTKLTRDEIEQTENEAYQEMYNQTQNNPQADEQNLLNNEQQNTNSVNDFQLKNANDTDDYNSTIAYQYQKSDNEKINQLRQDIVNNTNWNNSEKTHNYVNMLEKIITDKDIAIKIDGNLQDDKGRVANGSYSNGVITINPNSNRAGEFLAIHELTHAIGTNDMMNIVKKYMDNNEEFKANVQSLLKTYNKSEIDEEALADVSGQLFGNQEFINNIAQTRPNFFKRIYNEIKYLYHQFTGYKNQDQFVNDLYNKWTEAYNSNNELNNTTNYSIEESENNSDSFNLQKNRFDVSGNENLVNAKTLFYRTRDDGKYYVQATDGSGEITYDGVFYGEKQLARSLGEEIANKIVNTSESTNNKIYLQSDNIKSETDYMMAHRPTETGAYASNITKGTGEWDSLMPEDVYEHPERYFDMNQEYTKESFKALKQIKNNPNAEITIYRATTGNKINKGDWVTLSKKYAEYHNNSQLKGKGNIVELKVKAKDVQYAGDDINEFGYFPQTDIQKNENNVNNFTKYSIEEPENNSGSFSMDNQGRKLSKEQQEHFKDSKARNDNGNLVEVYHTTTDETAQFNEFNPVGTPHYRFGDQVVNYYTDSQDMSGSYANQDYRIADTKRLKSIQEANNYLKNSLNNQYNIIKNDDNTYTLVRDTTKNPLFKETKAFYDSLTMEEKNELKNNIYIDNDEEIKDTPYARSFSTTNISKELNSKLNNLIDGYLGSDGVPEIHNELIDLLNGENLKKNVKTYNSENQLLKSLKEDMQKDYGYNSKVQYIGYVDIKKPYEVDFKGKRWNDYTTSIDNIENKINSIPDTIKNEVRNNYIQNIQNTSLEKDDATSLFRVSLEDIYKARKENLTNNDKITIEDYKKEIGTKQYNAMIDYAEKIHDIYCPTEPKGILSDSALDSASYLVANNFNNDAIQLENTKTQTTNDIVKQVLDLNKKGSNYDGVIIKNVKDYGGRHDSDTGGTVYVTFNSNQFKAIDNTTPTTDADIRYSKENQSWREYLEKNFKTEGTTTKFSELEINNNQQRQEILNKAKQVEQINPDFKGLSDDIKNNYLNNKDIKLDDINEYLNNILKENETQKESNSILNESTYKEDSQRKKDYMKFKNDNTAYKKEEVNNALMSVKANRNGKRTVNQWKEVANQIGQQLAINNRNENYVQRIAFKSWFDLQPNTKESITRYDNQTKQNQPFQKFTSDDWVNTIYKSYKEQMQNMNVNVKNSVESQTTIKQSAQNNNNHNINTPGEMVDYSQMERPTEGKQRKFYKSIIESSNTTAEAKKISKELIGYDTYVPTSNVKNLKEADNNINTNGTENSLTALSTKVNNNEKITATDVATGERLIEYYSKVGDKEHLQEAIQTTALAGTSSAQALQAFALLNRMTPQGQVTYIQRSINKINKKLEDKYNKSLFKGNRELKQFNFTPEMQQEILNANGKAELESAIDDVYRQLGQQVPKSLIEKIDAWRYFSMLGNPRTHIRNMDGNIAMKGLQGIKNKVAGAIEDAVLGNQDVERTHTLKRASKETIAFAKNDINNVKFELGLEENKYNSQSMLSKYQNTFENKTLQNTFGKLMNLNDKLLEAEDGWGLKSNYVKSLSNYLTANNLDVNNISDKQLQKARNHAIKEAQEATFHQDCYIASAINTIENKNLATKVAFGSVLPFKKTPINITKTALEYNPVGLAKTITYDSVQLRKGNINVNQYIDNLSKGLTGTGVALLGFALAQSGIIKASGGDDDKKEDFEEGQGKQSYSITIGDHTYSLDWLAPTGIPLFVGAELYSLANKKAGGTEEKGASANKLFKSATNILNAGATSANPLSEMSMISGLISALQSYANGTKSIENMALNAGKSYINQFVPTSLGQVAKTLDTKERSTTSTASDPLAKNIDSLANQVKSKVPGLRETLPTKTDTWGNEINQEGNVAQRFLNNAIAPWSKKQITTNETDSKLAKLYDETGNSSVLPKNSINNTLTIDKQKYRLSNDEYSRLKKMYGETNYNILNDLMKSESFQSLDNEQKSKAVEKVYSYSQALIKSQYADMNDIDAEDAKIVQKVQDIARWGGKASDYFNFSGGSTDEETSNEKATRLKAMDISNKSKEAIYHYDFGQKDKNFSSINKIGVDIDDYLDFKSQKFENDESYTTKEQYMDYLDESTMPLKSKELLFATKYTLNEEQKDELFDYIDNSSLNRAEKLELFKNLKGFKVLENGNISY